MKYNFLQKKNQKKDSDSIILLLLVLRERDILPILV